MAETGDAVANDPADPDSTRRSDAGRYSGARLDPDGDAVDDAGPIGRALRWLRPHGWLIALLLLAVAVRVLVFLAYRPALMYPDSRSYLTAAHHRIPLADRPYGYSAFLNVLLPLDSVETITVVQHLLGLVLAVAGYALLVRRGVRRWIATLAVTPVALDARHVVLEHFILAETLFTVLLAAALLLLTWRGRVGVGTAVAAGALFAAAGLTRSVGLPLAGLLLLYLLIRRVPRRSLAAFAVAMALPIGGYLAWYHHDHGVYALGQYDGRFLYARVATFVDCEKLDLPDRYRPLCPDVPVRERSQRNDEYVWTNVSPAHRKYPGLKHDPFLRKFALIAITQQPLDYTAMVVRETGWHFAPPGLVRFDASQQCLARAWQLPVTPADSCRQIYVYTDPVNGASVRPVQATALRPALKAYSRQVRVPGPVLLLGIVLAIVAGLWRPRRPGWADGRDGLLFGTTGLGLIVLSVATSMYDPRYLMPALFFIGIGAALGANRFLALRRAAADDGSDGATTANGSDRLAADGGPVSDQAS